MAWFKVRKLLPRNNKRERDVAMKDLDKGMQLYSDIARAWMIKAIKNPLISIIQD